MDNKRLLLAVALSSFLIGAIVGLVAYPYSILQPHLGSRSTRTIVFQVTYDFENEDAEQIYQNVYWTVNKSDGNWAAETTVGTTYTFPAKDPRGWSPAGCRGHFEWNISISRNIKEITIARGIFL